jgi:glycosyltransferase involved in cell wall biosynthesis
MKNVLFITYFWPPSGKASLHWPLFVIKHLPHHGWQPFVVTADEDSFSHKDESLLNEIDPNLVVVKTPANEPFNLYRKFLGKRPDAPLIASETISMETRNWKHRLAIWVRMNLFVPDARVGWNFSAMAGARSVVNNHPIDAIVSIGPPHSSHLIGKKLSAQYNIPHIPVLIDPWVDIIYYKGFRRSRPTLLLDNYFERTTLEQAKKIVFVTQTTRQDYIEKYPRITEKSHVLYWGYNEENFQNVTAAEYDADEVLLHAGNIFDYQNPAGLWKNIAGEIAGGRRLRIRFIGTVGPLIKRAIDEAGLTPYTDFKGFLPYHDVVREMMNARYLLVCTTEKRHVPGKLFEYLRTGKPIIAFGDDNAEVEGIILQAQAGILFPYHYDRPDIFRRLLSITPAPGSAVQFSRERIAEKLAEILTAAVQKPHA